MEKETIVKSNQRVKDHGEVFTPKRVVNEMLNQDGIRQAAESLTSTFLEPSAGEGAFLVELLKRKTSAAVQLSETHKELGENMLQGLSTIYGIELLEDNMELLVMNLILEFSTLYVEYSRDLFNQQVDKDVINSAKTIIRANMVQGNSLTKLNDKGEPMIFSEWKALPVKYGVRKVQRTEYTFDAVLSGGDSTVTQKPKEDEEIDLLAGFFEDEIEPSNPEPVLMKFVPVKWSELWQESIEGNL